MSTTYAKLHSIARMDTLQGVVYTPRRACLLITIPPLPPEWCSPCSAYLASCETRNTAIDRESQGVPTCADKDTYQDMSAGNIKSAYMVCAILAGISPWIESQDNLCGICMGYDIVS